MNQTLDRLKKKVPIKKRLEWIVIAIVIVGIAGIYLSTLKPVEPEVQSDEAQTGDTAEQQQETEQRLMDVLKRIEGAGDVEVMITYESGPEIVPAQQSDYQANQSEDQMSNGLSVTTSESQSDRPVTISQAGSEQPVVIKEILPAVKGVIVVAEGADNIKVRMDLLQAVQTVLKVDAACVEVFKMQDESPAE